MKKRIKVITDSNHELLPGLTLGEWQQRAQHIFDTEVKPQLEAIENMKKPFELTEVQKLQAKDDYWFNSGRP